MSLTSQQRTELEHDGLTIAQDVLSPGEVRALDEHITKRIAALAPGQRSEHLDLAHHGDDVLLQACRHPKIVELVSSVLGPELKLFSSHVISKPAGYGLGVPWHQDARYWPLEPMKVLTVWLAVDDSDTENGCMRYLPGSHRRPLERHEPMSSSTVLDREIPSDRVALDEARDVCLRAGSVSLHHPHLVHGSNENRSHRRRCGYTMRFIPADVRLVAERVEGFPADWPIYTI
ncbi:MAG: phytanoyl-CoA dioxygenase family protein [Planctomycetota bacterium]